jgi:hypothetical protein
MGDRREIWSFFKNLTSITVNAATVIVNGGLGGAAGKGLATAEELGAGGRRAWARVRHRRRSWYARVSEETARTHAAEIIADEKACAGTCRRSI